MLLSCKLAYLCGHAYVLVKLTKFVLYSHGVVLRTVSDGCVAGELYLDYGRGFWEIQRDRLLEIEAWQRELHKALQVTQ